MAGGLIDKLATLLTQSQNLQQHYDDMVSTATDALGHLNGDNAGGTSPTADGSGTPDAGTQYKATKDALKNVITVAGAAKAHWAAVNGVVQTMQGDASTLASQATTIQAGLQTCDPGTQADAAAVLGPAQDQVNLLVDGLNHAQNPQESQLSCAPTTVGAALSKANNAACQEFSQQIKTLIYCGAIETNSDIKNGIGKAIDRLNCSNLAATAQADQVTAGIPPIAQDVGGAQDALDNAAQALPQAIANCTDNAAQAPADPAAADGSGNDTDTSCGPDCYACLFALGQVITTIIGVWSGANTNIGGSATDIGTAQTAAKDALSGGSVPGFEASPPSITVPPDATVANVTALNGLLAQLRTDVFAVLSDAVTIQGAVPTMTAASSNADAGGINGNDPQSYDKIAAAKAQNLEILTTHNQIMFDMGQVKDGWNQIKASGTGLNQNIKSLNDGVLAWMQAVASFATDPGPQNAAMLALQPVAAPLQQVYNASLFGNSSMQQLDAQFVKFMDAVQCIDAQLENFNVDIPQQDQQNELSQNTWNTNTPNTQGNPYAGTPYDIFFQGGSGQQRLNVMSADPTVDSEGNTTGYTPNVYDIWVKTDF